jgi:hypothetical protein
MARPPPPIAAIACAVDRAGLEFVVGLALGLLLVIVVVKASHAETIVAGGVIGFLVAALVFAVVQAAVGGPWTVFLLALYAPAGYIVGGVRAALNELVAWDY